MDEHFSNDALRREVEELRRNLSEERAVSRALEAGQVDAVVDRSGGRALLLLAAQAALQASEERYRTIAESQQQLEQRFRLMVEYSADGIILFNADGVFTYLSPSAERILGRRQEELLGQRGLEYVHPDDVPRLSEVFARQVAEPGSVIHYEFRYKHPSGTLCWIESSRVNRLNEVGLAAVVTTLRDVTERRRLEEERRRSEERFRESEERYRVLFDASPMPMWAYDPESLRIVMANQAAAEQFGYTTGELLALALPDVRPAGDAERITAAVRAKRTGRTYDGTWKHRRKDGSLLDVDVHSNDVELDRRRLRVCILHDVTEHRSLEEQLRQSQKMEAVGRLAGGVAHDFNNILTVIQGYGEMVRDSLSGDPRHESMDEMLKAAERATSLTRQLLAFSRKQVLEPVVLCPNDLIRNLEGMLRRLIGEDVDFVTRLNPSAGNVRVDPGQLEQVVMNLAINARDAMPRGGKLMIETANADLDEAYTQRHATVAGPYVMLAVSDTGVGIDAETQDRIFEPFFTTKEKGKGTGLGLSTVHGIVHQSGGNIWVYSEPGKGTTFKVYLPRVAGAAAAPLMPAKTVPVLQGSGTILLVEDEEQLRQLAKRILDLSGYTVLVARSPADALRIAREHDGPIHLLLTDVVMPDMSGPELAASLLSERPSVPVLYMSGYTDDAIVHHGVLDSGTHFIQKPFNRNGLVQRVREVMRGTR